ncbi:hypothetical protein PV11_03449 [Exophiala sideris]|uniref:Uncharacterized protein n=1 Tax=Exophiala sideris TaxID=1016849 RepID=A0A0D1YJR5_9EURO|nr:hypothetical protein PV11_03449 [Exophiala sideris]
MDNIIFEDPSKARIRSKQHVRAVPASFVTSSGRECTHEIEPQAVASVPEIRLQEHSHTSNVGHFEPLSLQDQTSETPLYELCRSPLHDDTAGDGRILEVTSLHEDFSIAQIDDNGLAESLDDDSDSLFSGVPPDLECLKTTGSDEHSDGQAQSYTSRVAVTRDDFVISSASDDLVRSGTPSLRTNSDAIDPTTGSNCPQPKLTAAPSRQRCFPQSSRHKPRIEVVIPSRRPSPVSQRNLCSTQPADVIVTPNGARPRTASPRPSGHVEHISGQKRRYRGESDFDSLDSHRVRVGADSNETPSLFHQTLAEPSAAHSRRKETQLHSPGSKYGAPIGAGIYNPSYESHSEQTLIDRGASINCEDQTGHDLPLREVCPTPASPSDIDEPLNSHHGQEQHQDLKCLSVHPVTPADAAFVTAIIDSPADLQNIFHSPAAWALECGVQLANLANIALKPLADHCWLLTATMSRRASDTDNTRRDRAGRRRRWSPGSDASRDFCPSEGETDSRPTKRGRWTTEEDGNLTRWRVLGKSWSWICGRFPERSEAAVRSRWFVVLAPKAKLT